MADGQRLAGQTTEAVRRGLGRGVGHLAEGPSRTGNGINETSLLANKTKELAVAGKCIGNLELLVNDRRFPWMIRPVDGHIQARRKLQGEPG